MVQTISYIFNDKKKIIIITIIQSVRPRFIRQIITQLSSRYYFFPRITQRILYKKKPVINYCVDN